jgi:hypothetical protein
MTDVRASETPNEHAGVVIQPEADGTTHAAAVTIEWNRPMSKTAARSGDLKVRIRAESKVAPS